MAGSGKTTLIQRINSHLHTRGQPGYIINLDPAVAQLPYSANIDIRDTVVALCEKPRDPPLQYIVADTPGQIEIFTWSASGQLVTELFASGFPTIVAYVIDTPRCAAPQTFMSNMLQAVSILYKTKLPLLLAAPPAPPRAAAACGATPRSLAPPRMDSVRLSARHEAVFNKIDVARHDFALNWMDDFDAYAAALEADSSYAATLSRSLSLVLSEFYAGIKSVGVSAVTGEGMDEMFEAVAACADDYSRDYLPEVEARRAARAEEERRRKDRDLERLRADMAAAALGPGAGAAAGGAAAAAAGASEGGGEDEGLSCDYEVSDDSIERSDEEERG
ncbi:hypothetical protein MNEG_10383 [Monoraphidium neglectum]|uniref:GPN-loop GTPase n=1 Tax=Monoraphidium neglectum TaxID=145388 RepID=A0A0D2MSU9_9CHLO|nr:hypothetical protein MNEG_10383 [Monoraphidium neglectum]KIY97580.1 hypothetical protein MNEG_10383 [Monoraphidium neglectum]|eukprot:XP_013896600.1 hypothetical protein MNEG_10383 [Monoraphidium neglectum]